MKRKTNAQKIEHLAIEAGPLGQAFILEAIRSYAQNVIDHGRPDENPRALINPSAWYACAESIANGLEQFEVQP